MSKTAQAVADDFVNSIDRLQAESQALQACILERVEEQSHVRNERHRINIELSGLRDRASNSDCSFETEIRELTDTLASLRTDKDIQQDIRNSNKRLSEILLELAACGEPTR